MEILIFNIIFLFFSIFYSFKNPTIFVCLQLLYHTQFMGFVSNEVLIGNVDFGSFFIYTSYLLPLLIKTPWSKQTDKKTIYGIYFISFFILYGLIKPVFDDVQSLPLSIKAGKSFFSYLLFFYVLVYRRWIDFGKIFNCVLIISIVFSILYIINYTGINLVPPYYKKHDFIQCKFDSYLVFAVIILLYKKYTQVVNERVSMIILLLCLGIYIGGYFSLFMTTIFILLFNPLFKKSKSIKEILFYGTLLCVCIFMCFLLIEKTDSFLNLIDSQMAAVESRERYNDFRWNLIYQKLYWGWGFVYKTAVVVKSLATGGYSETFSFIDSGYVDLFGRFGIVGAALFLCYPIYLIRKSLTIKKLYPFAFLIFQFLCINYTWSVFSFPMGIVVLSIVYPFIIKTIEYNEQKTIRMVGG